MERLYYVECEHETVETSDRLDAARIASEWARRGYKVETIAVDSNEEFVGLADGSMDKSGVEAASGPRGNANSAPAEP